MTVTLGVDLHPYGKAENCRARFAPTGRNRAPKRAEIAVLWFRDYRRLRLPSGIPFRPRCTLW